jgi:hypothetical protein
VALVCAGGGYRAFGVAKTGAEEAAAAGEQKLNGDARAAAKAAQWKE